MAKNNKNFNHFNQELENVLTAAETGMTKAVTMLEADTKSLTHVISGNLRRSWTHKVEASSGVVEGAVGSNLKYAPQEDNRHPNLSQALNDNHQTYMNVIANTIQQNIGQVR